jgi:lipopolysaccharide transport system permease protein
MLKHKTTSNHMSGNILREISNLFAFKDLFYIFVWREFNIRYRHSFLGILWAAIQPLSMMLLFTFVFTQIMPVKVSEYPFPLFFYTAILPWTFFSSSINYAVPSLVSHYQLITKIYFPREILPFSGIAIALIDFCIAFIFFILFMVYYKIPPTINVLWVIPLFILLFLFTTSISLILSALNVYYRDVKLAIGFIIQLWFFATPIFYSIDRVSPKMKIFLFLNPLTFIIENMRRCLMEGRPTVFWQYSIMFLFVASMTLLSYWIFKITEKKFADVI